MFPSSIESRPDVVPEPDHRITLVVFVTEDAQRRGAEQEQAPTGRVEAQPSGCEDPQEVAAGEQQHVVIKCSQARNDPIRSRANLPKGFATRTAVAEELPAWALLENLFRR